MRILFVFNKYKQRGGEEVVVANEVELLEKFGETVELFEVSNDQIQTPWDVLKTARDVAYSRKSYEEFRRKLEAFQPDVVHVHNFFPLLSPSIFDATFELDIPAVMTLHNYRLICASSNLSREGKTCEKCIVGSAHHGSLYGCYRRSRLASFAVSHMIERHRRLGTWNRKVSQFIALTEFSKSRFIKAGFLPERITVKPNFMEDPLGATIDREMHSGLFVGRLSGEKGIDVLLDAWLDAEEEVKIPLKIVGDGPMMESVQARIHETGAHHIQLLGELSSERVFEEMRKASFVVVPSLCYETFSMTTLEAFAHGLPVIASKIGSLGEVLSHGINGLHFAPNDPTDLRERVLRLNNRDLRSRLGQAARRTFLDRYTPSRNYEMLRSIYTNHFPVSQAAGPVQTQKLRILKPGFLRHNAQQKKDPTSGEDSPFFQ